MHPNAQPPTEYFIKWYSPLICSESCMSFGMIVTLPAWIADKFSSSNSPMLKASTESCIANNDVACKWSTLFLTPLIGFCKSRNTSLARHWNGILWIRRSVLFWPQQILRSATVPGQYRWGFLIPPVLGAIFELPWCKAVFGELFHQSICKQCASFEPFIS